MKRLRLAVVLATLLVALLMGSSMASAGGEWCDWGSPPAMDTGVAPFLVPPGEPSRMPTPDYKNHNGKFGENPVVDGALVPPGMEKANKK